MNRQNEKHMKSAISELIAQEFFISKGFIVSTPINHFGEYDLIIDYEGLYRIQVKAIYLSKQKNKNMCKLIISHRKGDNNSSIKKYTINSFDILCCVDNDTREIYNIPSKILINQQTGEFLTAIIMSKYDKYKNFLDFKPE